LDGPELAGEGGEAVEVVAGFVVAAGSSWMIVALATAVLMVGVGDTVVLVVLAMSLALGGVVLAVTVVDALTQVLLVQLEVEVILIDLSVVAVGSCRVVARLGAVVRVVRAQLLGLFGSHMQTSVSLDDLGGSLDNLGGLLGTLEHLEHHGEVGRWRGEDILVVVVEDEVGVKVTGPDR
jgi:hypothetical protein